LVVVIVVVLKKLYKVFWSSYFMQHKKKHLHPGARWLFRIGGYVGAFFFVLFVGGFLAQVLFAFLAFGGVDSGVLVTMAILMFLLFIVAVIVVAEIYSRMSYNRWFYEFGDDSLKLERGIIWKKYSNVPYERVQNVDIHRGIIARLTGFSGVAIQTAGATYHPRRGMAAEGSIPAVSVNEAEEIREFLMKKISRKMGHRQGM